MKKLSTIIYALWVVIAMFAYIGTASAVKNSVAKNSLEVKLDVDSKHMHPEITLKGDVLKPGRENIVSEVNELMSIISNINSGLHLNKSILKLLNVRNNFCKNKSYAISALHVLTKGFSQSFRQNLEDVSLVLSGGCIDSLSNANDIEYFVSYFYNLIVDKDLFCHIHENDEVFRLFDSSINIRRQHGKCKSISQDFLCSNDMTQDPEKFIKGVLAILDLERSASITSQVDLKSFQRDRSSSLNYSVNVNIEDLTAVQSISLKEYAEKVEDFFESLCVMRYCKCHKKEVSLHVDTECFSHLIVKFGIFGDSLEDKVCRNSKKVSINKREIINLSENVVIQVNDINYCGLVEKNKVVRYLLTPTATISHRGEALNRGHFIAKILTEETGEDAKWTMFYHKTESAHNRRMLAPGYDDYIIVYKAERIID